jgi:Pretoxin HINT domain/A nuclease family of the HNH/ENDO VII superfamily with conserved AHH/Pre-toxin TG
LIPVVGEVKGVMEAIWGRDLVTGQELEPWERLLGVIPLVSDAKKVFNAGDNIVKAADAARDAASAAEAAGDVTKASKAADAADAAVAANRRGLEDAQATGDPSKVTQAQTNLQKTEDAAREAREAANRSCFVAGTLILTPTGYRAIETLQVGDIVLAGNPETGEVKECRVLQTFEREVSQVLDVQVGSETITCTAEHPFWVMGKGWVGAGDLIVGDLLTTQTGTTAGVEKIEHRAAQVKVYNFEVEDFHTYFVSQLGILVHNTCGNLDRGDINQNIVGGVPDGYRGHHLIPVKVAQEFPVMQHAAKNLGYDINRTNNGIALPGSGQEALASGLPYHGGRHIPEYTDLARKRLDDLQDDYDQGLVTDANLIDEIKSVEDAMRSDLLSDQIRLQRNDPRPKN